VARDPLYQEGLVAEVLLPTEVGLGGWGYHLNVQDKHVGQHNYERNGRKQWSWRRRNSAQACDSLR
jgi:hypothetical protein